MTSDDYVRSPCFINQQAQSYESLKAATPMSANQRAKFEPACTLGRDEECRRSKFVLGGGLVGSAGGGVAGGAVGVAAGTIVCAMVLGIPNFGSGGVACAVVGGVVGAKYLGELGSEAGEVAGEFIYGKVIP